MVLGTVRPEAGPCERQPKVLKTKLFEQGPSDLSPLSPLRSDGTRDGQAGGWTASMVAKGEWENNSKKPRDLAKNRHKASLN
jgi:hypothetical protein